MTWKQFAGVAAFAGVLTLGGTAAHAQWSVTNLHPAGATYSYASAASGGRQAGYLEDLGGVNRASLWSGTAASLVDLHPAGSTFSFAYAISGGQQAGYAYVGGVFRASLWSGTAASWVDLNPDPTGFSIAYAISGGQQAGIVAVGGAVRASLWSGTAESWVDLNPTGSTESSAYAMSGGQQVGYTIVQGIGRASLWSGTADSWVDLHAYLPAGFSSSVASGISSDGVNTYVAGWGYNPVTNRNEALLWTQAVPTPGAVGLLGLGGVVAARRRRWK
ncbi:MAG: hypothetical protein ACK5UW_01350 [bacterium]